MTGGSTSRPSRTDGSRRTIAASSRIAPGLYLVGRFFLFSFTSALIGGVGRDAEHIAKHIVKRGSAAGTARVPGDAPQRRAA